MYKLIINCTECGHLVTACACIGRPNLVVSTGHVEAKVAPGFTPGPQRPVQAKSTCPKCKAQAGSTKEGCVTCQDWRRATRTAQAARLTPSGGVVVTSGLSREAKATIAAADRKAKAKVEWRTLMAERAAERRRERQDKREAIDLAYLERAARAKAKRHGDWYDVPDPDARGQAILDALRQAGQRARRR